MISVIFAILSIGGLTSGAAAVTISPLARWDELREEELRIATVAYRLSLANRQLCRATLTPQLGFVLHSIEQYGPADREEASHNFGLGAHVGVISVVANSPAARAGLSTDDQLVSVNGLDLGAPDKDAAGSTNARVALSRQRLLAALKGGPVVLHVSGRNSDHQVRFAAELGCPANVELIPGSTVNAWADGTRVVVSGGLLERCDTDDDLALVVAHEMSHNLLHHRERLALAGVSRSGLLVTGASGSAEMRETEEEADRLGVRLAIAAGYNLGGAASFLSRLMLREGMDRSASTHPAPDRRLALLTAEIAEAGGRPAPTSASAR